MYQENEKIKLMKQYSFLEEASIESNTYEMGKGFFNDLKTFGRFGKDAFKELSNNKTIKNGGGAVVAGGAALVSYTSATMNALMARKLTKIIKLLSSDTIDTREKAIQIFIDLGKEKDDFVKFGEMRPASVSFELSGQVAGPAIQKISNKQDPNWKATTLRYLMRQRNIMRAKATIKPIAGTLGARQILKLGKKG